MMFSSGIIFQPSLSMSTLLLAATSSTTFRSSGLLILTRVRPSWEYSGHSLTSTTKSGLINSLILVATSSERATTLIPVLLALSITSGVDPSPKSMNSFISIWQGNGQMLF